ncbi:MAG: tryptophan synthase subunit alpha [Caldithrix sp.]|nr:tryptophan synthase subunit alpha [Caldithrix sp.]
MMDIAHRIEQINRHDRHVLSIFLTAGFPTNRNFIQLAVDILQAGADMLEIGIPFSDPVADGPVIQQSSQAALQNGVGLKEIFNYTKAIKQKVDKPVVLMGYANPLLHYGLKTFLDHAQQSGADGLIVPDVPYDEYHNFWNGQTTALPRILLTTPTSSPDRIKAIDETSQGFIYCVSVTGTTGDRNRINEKDVKVLSNTFRLIQNNKMLVGFGISNEQTIHQLKPHCDGFIVGSAVIRRLMDDNDCNSRNTLAYIGKLSKACNK